MEEFIDCLKKKDWQGVRSAVLLLVSKTAGSVFSYLRVFLFSVLVGVGLFVGVSTAVKYQKVLTGTQLVYIMPYEIIMDNCGEQGCG